MRLNNYIVEAKKLTIDSFSQSTMNIADQYDIRERELQDIVDFCNAVIQRCQPFLKESKGTFMYRGMHGRDKMGYRVPRKDRRPMDTPFGISNIVDDELQKQFGFKGRSQALFTTGKKGMAQRYGPSYAVFPQGDFNYVYSPNISDSFKVFSGTFRQTWETENFKLLQQKFEEAEDWVKNKFNNKYVDWAHMIYQQIINDEMEPWVYKSVLDTVRKLLKIAMKYTNKDLQRALFLGHEVMVDCKGYYFIDTEYELFYEELLRL